MHQLFPSGSSFPPRYGHSTVVDDRSGLIYTMGGATKANSHIYDDIWQLDVISSKSLYVYVVVCVYNNNNIVINSLHMSLLSYF